MNPDTPPERIASMMTALETRPGIFECLGKVLFGWIDGGLYCRKLPKDEVLEKEIEKILCRTGTENKGVAFLQYEGGYTREGYLENGLFNHSKCGVKPNAGI